MPVINKNKVNDAFNRIQQHEARAPILSPQEKQRLTAILQQGTVSASELRAAEKIVDRALTKAGDVVKDVTKAQGWTNENAWVFQYEGAFREVKNAIDHAQQQTLGGKLNKAAQGLVDSAVGSVSLVVQAYALFRER